MPGAWEIDETRRNRVMVGVIYPPDWKVSLNWAGAFQSLVLPPGSFPMKVGGYPYGPARNQCVKIALESGAGWLFFLDSDVICPSGTVMRLLETGRDYIGALYHQRFSPYKPAAFNKQVTAKNEVVRVDLPPFRYGDIIPVDLLPAGATLISRRCLESVLARYPRPFEWSLDIDKPGGVGEDYDFTLKAASLGFQAYLHTGIECKHEVLAVSGVRGLEA